MWKGILFKRRAPGNVTAVVQRASTEFKAIANYKFLTEFTAIANYHELKSPKIFNENKRFLGKVIFIPQHSCLRERYTWYSDFPTFRCPFCSTKRPSLRNTPRFPQ